ncbi:hypothetical protein BD413DRAFT_276646 [Trametes elegans]|nr:hypothetical protein BD413DRAFT_276646 [Trametes elegans]
MCAAMAALALGYWQMARGWSGPAPCVARRRPVSMVAHVHGLARVCSSPPLPCSMRSGQMESTPEEERSTYGERARGGDGMMMIRAGDGERAQAPVASLLPTVISPAPVPVPRPPAHCQNPYPPSCAAIAFTSKPPLPPIAAPRSLPPSRRTRPPSPAVLLVST